MQACLPMAQARKDFPQPHFPCMSKFSCLRMKAQSAMAARSSLVKLRSAPQMTSSKSAVYLSLLMCPLHKMPAGCRERGDAPRHAKETSRQRKIGSESSFLPLLTYYLQLGVNFSPIFLGYSL